MMNRRDVLTLAVSAGGATVFRPSTARTAGDVEALPPLRIVDTNVSLFQWPFRRLPLDDADTLVKKLRSLGIDQAWAGSFEGVLQRDIESVNQRLADVCRKRPELIPIGSVNPELPGWEDDLRRCVENHKMPGIRLHPNYHGYALDDPRFARLLELATAAGLFVQLAALIEDTRTQHLQLQVADVDLAPLPEIVRGVSNARVQILNYRPRPTALGQLATTPGIFFDTARVESTDGVPNLMKNVPAGRVLFGSHAPFLIPEAALIRVHESDVLDDNSLRAVLSKNADRVSGKSRA
jgi:predicted TIM-barrel fold metal-dependent hydrolase